MLARIEEKERGLLRLEKVTLSSQRLNVARLGGVGLYLAAQAVNHVL